MGGGPRISAQEAHDRIREGYAYVDVRPPEEFADGHPEGAYNVPFVLDYVEARVDNEAFGEVMCAVFEKDAALVVGCRSGKTSARAREALEALGFVRVLEQRAGFDGARGTFGERIEDGWLQAGLSIGHGDGGARSWRALSARRSKDQ